MTNNIKNILKESLEDKFKEKLFNYFSNMMLLNKNRIKDSFGFSQEEAINYYTEYINYIIPKIENGEIVDYNGGLNLLAEKINSLGNLKTIKGDLFLANTNIKTLGNLEYVGGSLVINYTKIESLGNLKYVGEELHMKHTNITHLGHLEYVGSSLDMDLTEVRWFGGLKYVGGNLYTRQNKLPYTIKEIRDIVDVKGQIYK